MTHARARPFGRTSLRLLAVCALLSAAACATTSRPGTVEYLEGCWYFEREATTGAYMGLPWGMHLTGESLEGWPSREQRGDVRTAVTLTPDGARDHPFGYWLPLSEGDSVEVGYPAGGGMVALLEPADGPSGDRDYLAGTVRGVGDALPPGAAADRPDRETASVRVVRARCPDGG